MYDFKVSAFLDGFLFSRSFIKVLKNEACTGKLRFIRFIYLNCYNQVLTVDFAVRKSDNLRL